MRSAAPTLDTAATHQGSAPARRTGIYSRGMVQARYDAVADLYIKGFDSADDSVSLALLGLLGPVTGLRVLDVACGHGRITRELARRGAHVTGIDISGNLIGKAQEIEQAEPLGIRYVHADVTGPEVLSGHEFDMAVCSFGLSDIDDLDGALRTISAVLRARGSFAFSILHPCSPGERTSPGPGRRRAATTTKDDGRPREPCPPCGARSARITGCSRPTSTPSGPTICGPTRSPNPFRSRAGTRPTTPTASPYTSRSVPLRSPRPRTGQHGDIRRMTMNSGGARAAAPAAAAPTRTTG
jgi:2-polyprenyl-3-methyl-5-hydroxy-6-metoxy-1,4-benzoquinol methylase